ncbi:MAG: hypothetical protein J5J06_02830 [Phycisphaerae bacterium]|nr:hypothetical protein [Phycisphaerae bacterium]
MTVTNRDATETKRVRNELLVVLKVVYPAALQTDQIFRSMLVLFPMLELDELRRDLHYLAAKNYVERVVADDEHNGDYTAWRRRWFRLTTTGLELADRCIHDPALE